MHVKFFYPILNLLPRGGLHGGNTFIALTGSYTYNNIYIAGLREVGYNTVSSWIITK